MTAPRSSGALSGSGALSVPWALRSAGIMMAVTALVAVTPAGQAAALSVPVADIAAAPPDGPPSPDGPLRRNNAACVSGTVMPDSDLSRPPPPAAALRLTAAHRLATGAGVTVAVIDTGVTPSPRLPGLIAGGDYVDPAADGLQDCEGHGTAVAGLIGAAASPDDGLVGVAPGARVLSIRQTSRAWTPESLSDDPDDPQRSRTAGTVRTLARAIVHAVNLGARVVNISVVSCVKAATPIDQATLGGALRYAVDVKDAVVVAAAGNTGSVDGGEGGTACASNPDVDPANPRDARNWEAVQTVSTPSWFDPLVLSVGFVSPDGARTTTSMAGPWVDVAAPGTGVVSLSSDGAVINAFPGDDGARLPLAGSSYAAAYVSGTAALLRERFPTMPAREVTARIITTAHAPARGVDNVVGRGLVDPVAALSHDVPLGGGPDVTVAAAELALPPPPAPPDTAPQRTSAVVTGIVVASVLAAVLAVSASGARRRR